MSRSADSWLADVRRVIAPLNLNPTREAEIARELLQGG